MMKKHLISIVRLLSVLALLISCTTTPELRDYKPKPAQEKEVISVPLLVGTEWLATKGSSQKLRLIDYGRKVVDYQAGHIPGAVFVDRKTVWDKVDGIPGMLPSVETIDTRSPKEYAGEDVRAARGGHIPGAVNINWISNLKSDDSKTFAPEKKLAELYNSRKISKNKIVVTHCQTGVRGTHTYFVLKLLGYPKARVYDGSWAEWGNDWEAPIVIETIDSPK